MASFHKPKVFRSVEGCCICKAKSSSSRFTDSGKYEDQFSSCFRLDEEREGDICNACVLLVKRYKKLPKSTKKNWAHTVDSRAGPGVKGNGKQKKRSEEVGPEKFKKIKKKKFKKSFIKDINTNINDSMDFSHKEDKGTKNKRFDNNIFDFFPEHYWKRQVTCCGISYIGMCGEVMLDRRLITPCQKQISKSVFETLIETELRNIIDTDLTNKENDDRYSEKTDEGFSEKNEESFSDKASTTTGPQSPDSCRLVLEDD